MRKLQNPWSDGYDFSSIDSAHVGFGSDLEPTELEASHSAVNNSHSEAFKHQLALDRVEPSGFYLRSPISDLSAATKTSFPGFNTANFESYFGFDASTASAYGNFPAASSPSVADSSPRALSRISPHAGSSRGRSRSDGLLAVSRAEHQSHLINSTVNMLAPASHSSQPSDSPELASGMAENAVDSFSQSRSTTFSDLDFDSRSFDHAMALAEASYSAQISEDTPSHALQAKFHPAKQPNSSPCRHRESSPPDLFAPLNITPVTPPRSEKVRHQSLRFPNDLYTPLYVRNHGIKREGWCGMCRPGRWLVLKNSAFWYDKSFIHGISAASGRRFEEPVEVRRTTGKVNGQGEGKGVGQGDGWEGLCGTCGVWTTLGGGRRGGVPWFRHAYKCHTHPKVQDMPKRRRESKGERVSKTMTSRPVGSGGGDDGADGDAKEIL
ncbi:hypothetical protein HO133_000893 [Letharia lupina]|uniref:Transcription regulator Rua1 C-terminal domain-containing protein n=1 Tax=Letharia lupina TaxID=560253 RepID=A0A8H6CG14_9LECA|nr:uncharacterized protein HO133_000893 [Letharia lupina]KAF6222842.1 hypothetical protein HO133_000893 [Letharia lupina]